MRCAIWYHLSQLKKVKNIHGGVLLLKKVQAATLLKVALLHGCFSRFLNGANDIKSRKAAYLFLKMSLYDYALAFIFINFNMFYVQALRLALLFKKLNYFIVHEAGIVSKNAANHVLSSIFTLAVFFFFFVSLWPCQNNILREKLVNQHFKMKTNEF